MTPQGFGESAASVLTRPSSERPPMGEIAGYVWPQSVAHGEPLTIHLAGVSASCWVTVFRVTGVRDETLAPRLSLVEQHGPLPVSVTVTTSEALRWSPLGADIDGCGWPSTTLTPTIPDTWPSGLYLARITSHPRVLDTADSPYGADALFIVRPRLGQPGARALVQLPTATWNAYTIWQRQSLYGGLTLDGERVDELRAHRLSFQRPGIGLGFANCNPHDPTASKAAYAFAFIDWTEAEGFALDWCAGPDLDAGTIRPTDYRLIVTVGHDEYWSTKQRDVVESFVADGGNAAFLGGNLCYWVTRIAGEGGYIECSKRDPNHPYTAGANADPLDSTIPATVQFHTFPVNRSPVTLTGVSMRNDGERGLGRLDDPTGVFAGAAWWWEYLGGPPRPRRGFTVAHADHWLFHGTGLRNGDEFGTSQALVGHEADGVSVTWRDGRPSPDGRDGAPSGSTILAWSDCRDWAAVDFDDPDGNVNRDPLRPITRGAFAGVTTLVEVVRTGQGVVIACPTTSWPLALVRHECQSARSVGVRRINEPCGPVQTITRNVLRRLSDGSQ